jgi:hypothetical protein
LAFPKRVSQVPARIAWTDPKTGMQLPMFARYLAYVDTALRAIIAGTTLTIPRVALPSMLVAIYDEKTGVATQLFARYLDYIDNTLRKVVPYAIAHGHPMPAVVSQIPTVVAIFDPETGAPTDNLAQYVQQLDILIQLLIAAGV